MSLPPDKPSRHSPEHQLARQHRHKRIRRRLWTTLAALSITAIIAINAPSIFELIYRLRDTQIVTQLPEFPSFKPGEHVLVIAPHPDDETLCCAGAIQNALEHGANVSIAWITNGDGFTWGAILLERRLIPKAQGMIELGERRMQEARNASKILGIPERNQYFLGYPDGGLRQMLKEPNTPFKSRYTRLERIPYAGVITPNAAHTGTNLEHDLEHILETTQPTMILVPSPLDAHPDHNTTGELVRQMLEKRGETNKLRYWIIHGGIEWPLPKGWHTDLPLAPPPRGYNLPWQRITLTPKQIQRKAQTTRAYSSQLTALGRYLASFSRTNELLSPTGTLP
jgi:LmbE family N-acetylglucosaminyl deacetylase